MESRKNGTDEPIFRQVCPENDDIETGHVDTVGEGEGGINWESRINT